MKRRIKMSIFDDVFKTTIPKLDKETEKKVYKGLGKFARPTGSRVLGGFKPYSDYDYLILGKDLDKMHEHYDLPELTCGGGSYKYSARTLSYYFLDSEGRKVNLIVCIDLETMNEWVGATVNYLHHVKDVNKIPKSVRVATFEAFRKSYRLKENQ